MSRHQELVAKFVADLDREGVAYIESDNTKYLRRVIRDVITLRPTGGEFEFVDRATGAACYDDELIHTTCARGVLTTGDFASYLKNGTGVDRTRFAAEFR